MEPRSAKDEKKLQDFEAGKAKQEAILNALGGGITEDSFPNFESFV